MYEFSLRVKFDMSNLCCSSVAALTDCMRSKTLAKFFRDRQAALKRSLPLGSYLLKPVQRILKYHLLLQVQIVLSGHCVATQLFFTMQPFVDLSYYQL